MLRRVGLVVGALLAALVLYFVLWPVPIRAVAWTAPANPGFTGVYAANTKLAALDLVPSAGEPGPEAIARDSSGRFYLATANGWIVRLDSTGAHPEKWVNTGGRPLGMAIDASGTLWVADAIRGLLSVSPGGAVLVMATQVEGTPIRYADDLDIAPDGRVYMSDASTAFYPPEHDALSASILEVLEHRGTGRLIEYEPGTGITKVLARGIVFANGVAVTHDGRGVLVVDMGNYRVLRVERDGPARGAIQTFAAELPGFGDNLKRGLDGRYWLSLYSPRNALADGLAARPFLRQMLLRIPKPLRPGPVNYGHIVAFDSAGAVVASLQDPEGKLPSMTSVLETRGTLWLGSLKAPTAARLRWPVP